MSNMDLWNRVERTNPEHTKPAKIGGLKITAIAPQYQVMNATKEFGPYAIAWGFKKIELDFSLAASQKLVIFKGTFFCPEGECQIINSAKLYMDRAETMVDADFAKKIETDALTKCLSKMGFNADVFMGRYDDHRYVEQVRAEYSKPVDHTAIIEWYKTAAQPDRDARWPNLKPEQQVAINGALS